MEYTIGMSNSSDAASLASDIRDGSSSVSARHMPGDTAVTLVFSDIPQDGIMPKRVDRNWTGPRRRDAAANPKPRRRDAAADYLTNHGMARHLVPPKQHFKVHQHNGNTVYETTDNREAWAKRNAAYIDSLNTGPDAPKPRVVLAAGSKRYSIQSLIERGILNQIRS